MLSTASKIIAAKVDCQGLFKAAFLNAPIAEESLDHVISIFNKQLFYFVEVLAKCSFRANHKCPVN